MRKFSKPMNRFLTILLLAKVFFIFNPMAEASSALTVKGINFNQIESIDAIKKSLDTLSTECLKAKQERRFSFDFQEVVLAKSGECINKIVELEKRADLSEDSVNKEFRNVFSKNDAIFETILSANQEYIRTLQEEKLDKVTDVQAFFNSDQWQMPQRLISLSRYWMSWNKYYSSFLYPAGNSHRMKMLNGAIEGFSLALFDIEEQVIVIKSLFGRALCYKAIRSYSKAIHDLDSIIRKAKQDDPLYVWSRYEKAVISYLSGDFGTALGDLERLYNELDENRISNVIGDEHRKLKKKIILEPRLEIILADLEREEDKHGKKANQLCHDALKILRQLSENDEVQAAKLYQLVNDYSHFFDDLYFDELGPVGNLALADRLFSDSDYEKAAKLYACLCNSSHFLIEKRMDDIYFRSAYAYCQTAQWQAALSCFDNLVKKFPNSGFIDEAVCLQYVAAAGQYKKNPIKTCFARYIESIKTYLDQCPDPIDKSEAHFQLGKYYHDRGNIKNALAEFSKIEEDSPNYWQAKYYTLNLDMKKLESLMQMGKCQSNIAQKYYHEILSQLERFRNLSQNRKMSPGVRELTAYMTILQARLYTYGPEETPKKTIQTLEGFENRFPDNRQLWLTAKDLRMKCYIRYQMIGGAQKEISGLSVEGVVDNKLWSFLNEWSDVYYEEAKRLRDQGNGVAAGPHAEVAIMLSEKLFSIASKQASFKKYQNTIQLRIAELFMNENQTAKAREIYEGYLDRNPNSADALYNLGLIYEKEGKWQSALDVWRNFSKGVKEESYYWFESRYRIARAHNRMGENGKACEIITMIQVLHPEFREAQLLDKMIKLQNEVCENGDS